MSWVIDEKTKQRLERARLAKQFVGKYRTSDGKKLMILFDTDQGRALVTEENSNEITISPLKNLKNGLHRIQVHQDLTNYPAMQAKLIPQTTPEEVQEEGKEEEPEHLETVPEEKVPNEIPDDNHD